MAEDFTITELDELETSVQLLGTTIRQCNDRMDVQLDRLETSLYILAQKVVQLSKKIEGSDLNISVELQRALQGYRSSFPDIGSSSVTTKVGAMQTFVDVANESKGDNHPAEALEDSITAVDPTTTATVALAYKDEVLEDAEVADNDVDNSNHEEIEQVPTSVGVVIGNSDCVVTQMIEVEFASHNSFDSHNDNTKFVWPPHVLPMNWPRQRWGDYDNGIEKCLVYDLGYLHSGRLCLLSNTEIVPMLHSNSGINEIQMRLVFDPGATTLEARKRVRKAFSQSFFWTWQNFGRINTITNMTVFSSTIDVSNILNFSNACASAGQYAFKLPFEIRSCGCLNIINLNQRSPMPSFVSIHSSDKRDGLKIRYIGSEAAMKITPELDESEFDNGLEPIIDWDGRDEDEEEFGQLLEFAEILKVAEARGVKLPSNMTEAVKTTGIREMFLLCCLELQDSVWPLGFLMKHCSMLGNRMIADPSLIFKVGTEIAIDSCCGIYGLCAGFVIILITEYYTSHAYSPVQDVADSCRTVSIFVSFSLAAMYGMVVAVLGILSTIAAGLAIDAYGPISDNVGLLQKPKFRAQISHLLSELKTEERMLLNKKVELLAVKDSELKAQTKIEEMEATFNIENEEKQQILQQLEELKVEKLREDHSDCKGQREKRGEAAEESNSENITIPLKEYENLIRNVEPANKAKASVTGGASLSETAMLKMELEATTD